MRATSETGSDLPPQTHEPRNAISRGFTLVEILLVIAVMSLLAAALPFAINRMVPARRLALATQQLATIIGEMQAEASLRGQTLRLQVSSSDEGTQISYVQGGKDQVITFAPSTAVRLTLRTIADPTSEVLFFPDGSTSGAQIALADGRHGATLGVSTITGRVEVRR